MDNAIVLDPARHAVAAAWREVNAAGGANSTGPFLLRAYERMASIRAFERRCLDLGRGTPPMVAGSVHVCAGQEAIPVGAMAALRADDRVVATYRGHGWVLECGVPLDSLLGEVCHRAGGINGGRAGSPYVMAPEFGFLGENSIVGAGGPIACGAALAARHDGSDRVTVVSFGDGATSQGALHEAMVFAAAHKLAVVFLCEHNGWSELTPTDQIVRLRRLAERARGYPMAGATLDGNDPLAVRDVMADAVARARAGEGPSFLECRTVRLWGHYSGDTEHYRPKADREAAAAADPLRRLRARLIGEAIADEGDIDAVDRRVEERIDAVTEMVRSMPLPDPDSAASHVFGGWLPEAAGQGASEGAVELTYAAAVNRALQDELSARPDVVVYGEDVGYSGGVFGVTRDLQKTFGAERVFDTPIAESAILGSGVGAALEGLRPVVEIMWSDFLLVALDPLVNQAANVRYVTRGRGLPLVVRTQQGATPGSCSQHSQSLEAMLVHVPGLLVAMPATPEDAYAMLRTAVAADDPCIIIESRALYRTSGAVRVGMAPEPPGRAKIRRPGRDVAILTWGRMQFAALDAAQTLETQGIDAAVVDLRWLSPLDDSTIADVITGCDGRVVIAHEANRTAGVGAEIAARIAERHFGLLRAPIRRVATPDSRIPASPLLQAALIPDGDRIAAAAAAVARHGVAA